MTARLMTCLILLGAAAMAQARPIATVVDEYVRVGLESNLELKGQGFDVAVAMAAVDGARARFWPELGVDARYGRNWGGRVIDIPLSRIAPGVEDESFRILRETEQDTRLVGRQPLYAPAIPAALRARRFELDATEYSRIALARLLKRDITVGYLDWLRATRNVSIVDSSVTLLAENLRVNEALYRNGRVTQDLVLRARAELLEAEQQAREVRNLAQLSRSFLNFLLNRPLDTALEEAELGAAGLSARADLDSLRANALDNRPELEQVASQVRAAEAGIDVARAERKPQLALGFDGGTQGDTYGFGRGFNVASAGLQFTWNLFDGGARRAAVSQARFLARKTATQRDEVAQQIQLEVQQALDRLETAEDSLATAEARTEAAQAGFRIASRKRDEGVISQVEFIDARSTLTSAEINLNLTRFALLSREAELDYATASGPLPLPVTNGE